MRTRGRHARRLTGPATAASAEARRASRGRAGVRPSARGQRPLRPRRDRAGHNWARRGARRDAAGRTGPCARRSGPGTVDVRCARAPRSDRVFLGRRRPWKQERNVCRWRTSNTRGPWTRCDAGGRTHVHAGARACSSGHGASGLRRARGARRIRDRRRRVWRRPRTSIDPRGGWLAGAARRGIGHGQGGSCAPLARPNRARSSLSIAGRSRHRSSKAIFSGTSRVPSRARCAMRPAMYGRRIGGRPSSTRLRNSRELRQPRSFEGSRSERWSP